MFWKIFPKILLNEHEHDETLTVLLVLLLYQFNITNILKSLARKIVQQLIFVVRCFSLHGRKSKMMWFAIKWKRWKITEMTALNKNKSALNFLFEHAVFSELIRAESALLRDFQACAALNKRGCSAGRGRYFLIRS